MKKIISGIVGVVFIAGIASADLAVDFFNTQIGVQDGAGNFLVGKTVQLVWSPTEAITATGVYDVTPLAVRGESDGEDGFVLTTGVTGNNGLWTAISGLYTSADVGSANINTGYFYVRIFNNDNNDFVDFAMEEGANYVYSPTDTSTTYSQNSIPGSPGTSIFTNQNATTTTVPEPATFGLMGLAGLGLFMARRSALKKARRI